VDLVYVTSRFPFGPGEGFIGPEVAAHLESGVDLRLFPMWPRGGSVHSYAREFGAITDWPGVRRATTSALRGVGSAPSELARNAVLAATNGTAAVRGRNLAVLPRAAALIDVIRRGRPEHVHVHWGGASSTVAMVACEATGTPWSMTLHRWDIRANNLLAEKISAACFTRVISRSGAAQVEAVVPGAQPRLIHMGIDLPIQASPATPATSGRIACIASLVPVKNHSGLLDAFRDGLQDRDVMLDLVGDGPLREQLQAQAARLGIASRVRFLGTLDHGQVLRRLGEHEWAAVVLASGATDETQEGIPVSLMEAMASIVPVVATDSGGTGELVGDGAGLLVPVGDRVALANALRRIVTDVELRSGLAEAGRRRVAESFDVKVIAAALRARFSECAG
jgi:colanic acid/amylovoran biosynthesis glycosyltransferase